MPTRRDALAVLAGATVAAFTDSVLTASQAAQPGAPAREVPPAGPFTLSPLPYPADALEPHIDAQTMTIHHDRHHQTYVNNLNAALKDRPELRKRSVDQLVSALDSLPVEIRAAVRNNGGGHLNHDFFWASMRRNGGGSPVGELSRTFESAFGGFDKWQDLFMRTATGDFGSGWAWLSWDPARKALVVDGLPNQDSPVMQGKVPILGVDVWEHAYYLKYQNRRADYVKNWFNVIDWDVVSRRLEAVRRV
jgi:Fe-Mn family superoxide dismutase